MSQIELDVCWIGSQVSKLEDYLNTDRQKQTFNPSNRAASDSLQSDRDNSQLQGFFDGEENSGVLERGRFRMVGI